MHPATSYVHVFNIYIVLALRFSCPLPHTHCEHMFWVWGGGGEREREERKGGFISDHVGKKTRGEKRSRKEEKKKAIASFDKNDACVANVYKFTSHMYSTFSWPSIFHPPPLSLTLLLFLLCYCYYCCCCCCCCYHYLWKRGREFHWSLPT